MLSSVWILKLFNHFCRLIPILVYACFPSNRFLSTIFYYSLLAYGFTHSTSHASKTAWLKRLKVTSTHTTSHSTAHYIHAHTTSISKMALHTTSSHSTTETSSTEEIIVIIESSHLSKITHSTTHASKWMINTTSKWMLVFVFTWLFLSSST